MHFQSSLLSTRWPEIRLHSQAIFDHANRAFSLTWPASMLNYWNKRKFLHKKRVQLPQDCLGTPTWPPFYCFGTPIWPPWRRVKTLNSPKGFTHLSPDPVDLQKKSFIWFSIARFYIVLRSLKLVRSTCGKSSDLGERSTGVRERKASPYFEIRHRVDTVICTSGRAPFPPSHLSTHLKDC